MFFFFVSMFVYFLGEGANLRVFFVVLNLLFSLFFFFFFFLF